MSKTTDPFGGIKGEKIANKPDLSTLPPMQIDQMEALKGIKKSLDQWDGVGEARPKGTLLERFRQKAKNDKVAPPNWNYITEFNKDFADVHLRWSGQTVRSIKHVPRQYVRVALVGLNAFYKNLNPDNPDLSHPDILKCFNFTAKHFGIEQAPIPEDLFFDPEIHQDPFAGIKGKDALRLSEFNKDLQKAIDEVEFSIEFIEQIDVPTYRKEYRFKTRKPKNLQQTYPTSTSFFDVLLWWPGGVIQKIDNVATQRARIALASMLKVLKEIDVESPNLEDGLILQLYEQSKNNFKPGYKKNDHPDLRPTDEGGTSYWSKLTHRWVKGRMDKKNNIFIPPKKGE